MTNDEAVQRGIENAYAMAAQSARETAFTWDQAAHEHMRPSVLFRPTLTYHVDTRDWVARYNDMWTRGASPAEAMQAFDEAWGRKP